MKKIRFLLLLTTKFIGRTFRRLRVRSDNRYQVSKSRRKPLLIVALIIIPIILVWAFWNKQSNLNISQGIVGVYTQNSLPSYVGNLISEPLIILDKSGVPKPNLVSDWQINNDSTLYTFKLKDNLYWHDGSRVKSEDLKFNLPNVEVSYPNETTLEFKLAEPFSPLPALLTAPILKQGTLLGVGKYKVLEIKSDRNIITRINLEPASNDSQLAKINLRFYQDESTAYIAFNLGEIDSILGATSIGETKDQPTLDIKSQVVYNKLVAVFFNTKDPLLSDKNLRKALNLMTPVIEGEERAKTSLPPFSWAFNQTIKDLDDKKLETAKEYLKKVNNLNNSTIILTTTPSLSTIGEKVIDAWKKLGLQVVLRVESGFPQNFQALLTTQLIPPDPDQYLLWHSTQAATNLSKYDSKRVDKDLEDGRKTSDQKIRIDRYLDFQKVLADDVPAVFLYFPKSFVIYRKKNAGGLNQILDLQLER